MQQTQEQQHKYMEGNLGSLEEDNEDVCEPNMTLASLREEHMHEINWQYLSLNPHDNAVTLLLQHLDRLDWDWIAANPNDRVVDLWLQMFQDEMLRMDWKWLSLNSNDRIVDLLLAHPDKINKQQFSRNKNDRAVAFLLQQQPFWISWACLSSNENPQAVAEFIYTTSKEPTVPRSNPPFPTLSFAEQTKNPTSIEVNEKEYSWHSPNKPVNWGLLATNANDMAVSLLLQHPEKHCILSKYREYSEIAYHNDSYNWFGLSQNTNPRAIALLLTRPDLICWESSVWANPQLFNDVCCDYILK